MPPVPKLITLASLYYFICFETEEFYPFYSHSTLRLMQFALALFICNIEKRSTPSISKPPTLLPSSSEARPC